MGEEVNFPGAMIIEDEFTCNMSKVSHDGRRLAVLSYGQRKAHVQILQLDSDAPPRKIQLLWLNCDNPNLLVVAWSPDLSILVVDAQVFDLTSPNNDTVSDPFVIQDLTRMLPSHRVGVKSGHFANLGCQISSCKSFIAFTSPGDRIDFKTYPGSLLVFRIELRSRLSTRLQIELPDTLSFMSAHLHPSLPLMAMSFASATETQFHDLVLEPPQWYLRILDLESLVVEVIDVPDETPVYVTR